ncbi:MAG: acyl carrier protein [Planctomycetia bacterium]|nr:acyl carrier protein [Planctomycetia bacterium]
MTRNEIREAVMSILRDIAPDEDISDLNDEIAFREQMELDSMDFLDIVMELRRRYGVNIPEEEYTELASMAKTVNYLEPKMVDIPFEK